MAKKYRKYIGSVSPTQCRQAKVSNIDLSFDQLNKLEQLIVETKSFVKKNGGKVRMVVNPESKIRRHGQIILNVDGLSLP